ncbi:MAG: hypothetical protein ACI88L_000447 [Candidatus Paceibacteria bacterium]|jgi:hypothetical protein
MNSEKTYYLLFMIAWGWIGYLDGEQNCECNESTKAKVVTENSKEYPDQISLNAQRFAFFKK